MTESQTKDPLVEIRGVVRADRRKLERVPMTGLELKSRSYVGADQTKGASTARRVRV